MCDIDGVWVKLGQGAAEENPVLINVRSHIRFRFTPGFRWMLLYRWSKEWTMKAVISGCRGIIRDNGFQPPDNRHTSTVVYVSGVIVTPLCFWKF